MVGVKKKERERDGERVENSKHSPLSLFISSREKKNKMSAIDALHQRLTDLEVRA